MDMVNEIKRNSKYSILTNKGFKKFDGVMKSYSDTIVTVITKYYKLKCSTTPDHKTFINSHDNVPVSSLNVGDTIYTKYGYDTIESIEYKELIREVFDILNVEDTHNFFCNDILQSNCVLADEFSFVPYNIQEDFFSAVYPTISSGKTTKFIMISTPNGMEKFYSIYNNAIKGKNSYVPFRIKWNDVPGRDEEFKQKTIADIGQHKWDQEYDCKFLSSQNSLLSSDVLENIVIETPIHSTEDIKLYEESVPFNKYVATLDVAEGVGLDYTVLSIFDVSEIPYKQVFMYRSNTISPFILPELVVPICRNYNDALLLIEAMGMGIQVANDIYTSFEYDNIVRTTQRGRKGQIISSGFGSNNIMGVKMTQQVKRIGCSNLKSILENQKLLIRDFETISELSSFVKHGDSYAAEDGRHDDIVMTLVLFSWLISQQYYKDLMNQDIRDKISRENETMIYNNLTPFGIINNGMNAIGTKEPGF